MNQMAAIKIEVDEKLVKEEVQKQIEQSLVNSLWYIDVAKLSELTSLSKRTLESFVLCDARVKAIEIKRDRKRLYKVEAIKKVLDEIFAEW
ncbi:hypothetical protein MKZ17_17370 [Solibacillus sp. FSL R7-0682]|uniref:hypothetical protein n=1 Tax=Solibacillus sp. FSL R7-0682 TaxID=2921690 RepID=UPI0030FAACB2